jgi:hypothetical protein
MMRLEEYNTGTTGARNLCRSNERKTIGAEHDASFKIQSCQYRCYEMPGMTE